MRRAGEREGDQQRPEGVRDLLGAAAGGERAEEDHHREQRQHQPDRVGVEDQLDRVADRGQLDDRADGGDADVALEVGLAPEGDRGRERDQRQRGGDLPERDVDRGRSRRAPARPGRVGDPARLEPHHPVAQPARLLGVVADEDERDLELARAARARVASIASRAAWSRAEVGSSSSRTSGCWASARASIARCCSPTESFGDVALGEAGIEAGERAGSAPRRARSPASPAA